MIPALSPFSLLAISSTPLTIVSLSHHLCLAGYHLTELSPAPATYNLSQSGAGDYFIKPLEHFTHADADEAPKDLYATVGAAAKVKLISNLAVFPVYDKRGDIAVSSIRDEQGRFRGCSPGRQARILSACRAAQTLAHNAHTYLQGISIGTPQYSTWFGAYDAARKATVESHFEKIDGTEFSSYTYDCTCKRPNMYAYVSTFTFQSRDRCSVTDKSPEQISTDPDASTSVLSSGNWTSLVRIPRQEG